MTFDIPANPKQLSAWKAKAEEIGLSIEQWISQILDKSSEEFPDLMTPDQVARYLKIPKPTVYYLLQTGRLPGLQIGGRWKIKKSLVDCDILNQTQEVV